METKDFNHRSPLFFPSQLRLWYTPAHDLPRLSVLAKQMPTLLPGSQLGLSPEFVYRKI